MINKILGAFIIFFILYIITIFKAPLIADKIEGAFGLKGFNEFVLDLKTNIDSFFTKIPSPEDIKDTYDKTLSGAIELKDHIKGGAEDIKSGVDEIRANLSGAVDTYEDVKETVMETKESIENTVETIKDTSEKVSGFSSALNDSFSGTLNN